MAYTNSDLVVAMFRDLTIASDTVITDDKLATFIDQQEAYINGKLASYYVTPIDSSVSPISAKIIEMIATYKVAHVIKTILEITVQNSDQNQVVQTNLDKAAEKILGDLLPVGDNAPVTRLPDAKLLVVQPESGVLNLQARTPTFVKGGRNW